MRGQRVDRNECLSGPFRGGENERTEACGAAIHDISILVA